MSAVPHVRDNVEDGAIQIGAGIMERYMRSTATTARFEISCECMWVDAALLLGHVSRRWHG